MQTDDPRQTDLPVSSQADSAMSLGELFGVLWEGRWWIATSVAVLTTAFVVAAFLTTPVYRTTALLMPASLERSGLTGMLDSALGPLGGLASLAGINLGSQDLEVQEALAVLRSRQFTESFIRDKNLMPRMFDQRWDAKTGGWKGDREDWPTAADAYRRFNKKIRTVAQDRKTNLVILHIDWRDRQEAAQWANELVERLNAEMRARAIARAKASVGFLERELQSTADIGTREAINRLMEAQIRQRMLANVTREYAFRIIDRAMVPDRKDKLRPRKLVMLVMGAFSGLLLGAVAVLAFRRRPD